MGKKFIFSLFIYTYSDYYIFSDQQELFFWEWGRAGIRSGVFLAPPFHSIMIFEIHKCSMATHTFQSNLNGTVILKRHGNCKFVTPKKPPNAEGTQQGKAFTCPNTFVLYFWWKRLPGLPKLAWERTSSATEMATMLKSMQFHASVQNMPLYAVTLATISSVKAVVKKISR